MPSVRSRHASNSARLALGCAFLGALAPVALAAPPTLPEFRVGVAEDPPFATRDSDGAWHGLTVELWYDVADRIGQSRELVEFPSRSALLAALEAGTLDIGVVGTEIVPVTDRSIRYSAPYESARYRATVRNRPGDEIRDVASHLFGTYQRRVYLALAVLVVLFAVAFWLAERRHPRPRVARDPVSGVADSIWWSATTITTVGYGDIVPRTRAGRIVGIACMFIALIATSIFTATVTSAITIGALSSTGPRDIDLRRSRVVAPAGGHTADWLNSHSIPFRQVADVHDALAAVLSESADVAVTDELRLMQDLRAPWGERRPFAIVREPVGHGFYALPLRANLDPESMRALSDAVTESVMSPSWEFKRSGVVGETPDGASP